MSTLASAWAKATVPTRRTKAFGAILASTRQCLENPMISSIVIQKPAGVPHKLILLFHGVGASAQDMVPVGKQFAAQLPAAMVVSLEGVQPSDFGQGRQWFSVAGITEENRPERVAAAMPAFQALIQQLQKDSGVLADQTTLVGFSQGSIMALESTQRPPFFLAGHVIAFSGRFAVAPTVAPKGTAIHLIHGDADPVMSVESSRSAAVQLQALGTKVSLDIEPGMRHGINARMMSLALGKLG
jgi:phospholipase/carboxylesterase